ncbi:PPE domain-containing protein [Mycolicibacterium celeriflavum]|uniref:PPE domain-containing protein n=1 Tax=Mycolicibacterium celeriflavum TaxID=1249101 RepID=UPI003CEE2ADB
MGEVQRVEPAELTKQSAEMRGVDWHNPFAHAVAPPDALPSSAAAVANLNANAQSLLEFQRWAETENQRIAEMLQIAADAYIRVDEACGRAIEDPARQAAVEAIAIPAPATPPPAPPHPVGAPQRIDAGGYSDVYGTQADLIAGDDGASLKAAMLQWGLAATRVRDNAPRPPSGDWEGRAADAAYARMTEFAGWLEQLAEGWHDLAEAAAKIIAAHDAAKAEHAGIHGEYVSLETQLRQLAAQTTIGNGLAARNEMARIQKRMQELQRQSDEVRRDYASGATFSPVRPAMPAVRGADNGGAVGSPGGGGRPGGDPAGLARQMAPSFGRQAGATTNKPGGGERSGGQPGGGAPAGGGAPSGGSGSGGGTSGGAPGSRTRMPTTCTRCRSRWSPYH